MVGFSVLTLTLFALPDDPVIAHVGLFGLCSILVVLGGGMGAYDDARYPWLADVRALLSRERVRTE
jgi:hypothetical protein